MHEQDGKECATKTEITTTYDLCLNDMSRRSWSSRIELRHLRVLVALADEGTFTDAAIELGMSQPAVSRALAQFEAILEVELVRRSTRSLELTGAGEVACREARTALRVVQSVSDAARGVMRPLRIGYSWAALGAYATSVVKAWGAKHPDVPFEFHRIDGRDAGLARGAVDIAVRRGFTGMDGCRSEIIFDERRMAAVAASSILGARTSVALSDLAEETIAIAPETGTTTLDLWPTSTRPTRAVEVDNADEWLLAIASGAAVGVTTESTPTHHSHPGVRFIALTDAPTVAVSLVTSSRGSNAYFDSFVKVVRDCVAAGPTIL